MNNTGPHPKLYTGKVVARLISCLLMITLLSVFGGIALYFKSLGIQADIDMARRVQIAMSIEMQRQEDVLEEYTFWDDAHKMIFVENDLEWIDLNTGRYMTKRYGYEFMIGLVHGQSPIHFTQKEGSAPLEYDHILQAGLDQILALSLESSMAMPITSGYIRLPNGIYRVTASPFMSETLNKPQPDHTYLVAGKLLDTEYVKEIADTYKLPGLAIAPPGSEDAKGIEILDLNAVPVASLKWDKPTLNRPSYFLMLGIIAFVFLILGIAIQQILSRQQKGRKKYEQMLYDQATKDYLTGAHNRRLFMEIGTHLVKSHYRNGKPLAAVLIDVDEFKVINDTQGHAAGDRALIFLASTCIKKLRSSDIIGRIGGDEFALLLPETDREGALRVVERIREEVSNHSLLPQADSPHISISLGVAFNSDASNQADLKEVLELADKALYRAKKDGRNCTVLYSTIKQEIIPEPSPESFRH